PHSVSFDEYHHGEGVHPGTTRAIVAYSVETRSGHVMLSAAIAGLLLLFSAAPRPIRPPDVDRIPRRSPLEQADALAQAYERVKATRTVVTRLLGGVRRRAIASRRDRSVDDRAFLKTIAESRPALSNDAARVQRALDRGVEH